MSEREVPNQIDKHWQRWAFQVTLLRLIKITLGIVGLVSSVVIVSAADGLSPERIRTLALVAAISTGVVSFTNLSGKANQMRSAWRLLAVERLRYLYSGGELSCLIDTYERAERLVGDVNFNARTEDLEVEASKVEIGGT